MGLQHRDVPRCQAGASWGRSLQFLIFCFETPALAASFPPGQSEPVRALTAGRNVQQINQPLRFNASKTQTPLRRPFRGPPCPHLAAQGFGQGRGTGPCCRASTRVAVPVRVGTRAPACACSCLHTPTPPCSCPRSLCRLPGCQERGGVLFLFSRTRGTCVIRATRLRVGIWAAQPCCGWARSTPCPAPSFFKSRTLE